MLVLRRARLVCIVAGSISTLLLQGRVLGHKRAYGEMHNCGRRRFRGRIRRELELCARQARSGQLDEVTSNDDDDK